jgi:hypothetical protein
MEVDLKQEAQRLLSDIEEHAYVLGVPLDEFKRIAPALGEEMLLPGVDHPDVVLEWLADNPDIAEAWATHCEKLSVRYKVSLAELSAAHCIGKAVLAEVREQGPSIALALRLGNAASLYGMAVAFSDLSVSDSPAPDMAAARSQLAAAGAAARHAPSRARKATWRAWYQAHRHLYTSKDAAAEAIAAKAGVTWRTARDWLTDPRKE